MSDRDLELRLRGYFQTDLADDRASPLLAAQVDAVPDTVPAGISLERRTLLLLAAALLVSLVVGSAIAVGSGIVRLPWITRSEPEQVTQLTARPGLHLVEGGRYEFAIGAPQIARLTITGPKDDWQVAIIGTDLAYIGEGDVPGILGFAHPANLYADPYCWWQGPRDPPVDLTANGFLRGLSAALTRAPSVKVDEPIDTTLGGLPARKLTATYTWPPDQVTGAPCDPQQVFLWTLAEGLPTSTAQTPFMQQLGPQAWWHFGGPLDPGWTIDFYALEINGSLVVVEAEVATNQDPDSLQADAARDLDAMLSSLEWSKDD